LLVPADPLLVPADPLLVPADPHPATLTNTMSNRLPGIKTRRR
jgi:hypothetical protein